MNIFERASRLWLGFWNSLLGQAEKNNQHYMARGFVEKQKRNLVKLKGNMAELIFQRKKFETRLTDLENEQFMLKQDLETAAHQDRDELALKLMERMEQVSADIEDSIANLNLVREEIETARTVEQDLQAQIEKSESQIAVLISRMESVKLREQLQGHFSKLHTEITQMKPGFSQIEEQIMKLESKLETIQEPKAYWKAELKEMRQQRSDHRRNAKLVEFKNKMKRRQLPGRAISMEAMKVLQH